MLQITDETEEVECEGKVSELVDCARDESPALLGMLFAQLKREIWLWLAVNIDV